MGPEHNPTKAPFMELALSQILTLCMELGHSSNLTLTLWFTVHELSPTLALCMGLELSPTLAQFMGPEPSLTPTPCMGPWVLGPSWLESSRSRSSPGPLVSHQEFPQLCRQGALQG